MSNFYDKFTNRYPVTKTLQFELIPVGETRETIDKNNILEKDTQLAEDYQRVRKLLDELHKKIIDESLTGASISVDLLEELFSLTCEKVPLIERVAEIEALLRKEVSGILTGHKEFKKLFGAEVITEVLPALVDKEEDLCAVLRFNRQASMFQNYHVIRRILYSAEESHSTVAYRVIHENLPKFMENIKVFDVLCARGIDFGVSIDGFKTFLGEICLEHMFSVDGFNSVLTQTGIDYYNQVIGGVATGDGLVPGLNVYINLWNQQHPDEKRLPLFMPLYKQIMSEGNTASFRIDSFTSDSEVLAALKVSCIELEEMLLSRSDGMSYLDLFQNMENFSMDGIYVKSQDVASLSLRVCGNWRKLGDFFTKRYDESYSGKKKPGTEKYEEEKKAALKKVKDYSLAEIRDVLYDNLEEHISLTGWIRNQATALAEDVKCKMSAMCAAIKKHREEVPIQQHSSLIDVCKDYLDAIKELQWFLKLFDGSRFAVNRDMVFYSEHSALNDRFMPFNTLYNKVRNYVTKKPFSEDTVKLNFDSPSLMDGWSVTKESSNLGMILMKDGKYYLGIAEKSNTGLFRELEETEETDFYEKMEYRLLPGPNKMLPRVCFSAKGLETFQPSEEILRIYKDGSFKKGAFFSIEDCHKLIDFYKDAIARYDAWAPFNFKFSPTEQYKDISDFFREVSDQGYKVDFKKVSAAVISQMVKEGRLYLFQIYRKDMSEYSKGNLDLQTIYFNMLFDKRNLENAVYKLNGEAEVFYRKASIDVKKTPIHRANEPVANKNPLNGKKASLFEYDIIKNRRYTKEKFLFHVPVTMNFKAENQFSLNAEVENEIRKADDLHIIGINRGERNLLYVVVINSTGEIVEKEQFSLNVIESVYTDSDGNTKNMATDYHGLLDRREKERDAAQKSWQQMERIKEIKKGYLSQVVHKITGLALKYNAIIVMEDLSSNFVNGRKKIDKAIYQEFEGALLKKLNYLITDKSREQLDVHKPGGALNALQLTNKFESFGKIGWHSGIVFYVSPWSTSGMDPTTGFVNLLKPHYASLNQAQEFFAVFDSIRYNLKDDYFEFSFDLRKFKVKADAGRTDWAVCTYGRRLERFKNPEKNDLWDTRDYDPTAEMKVLLCKHGIDYMDGKSFHRELLAINEVAFYKELMHIIALTLQMHNYTEGPGTGTEEFFQSCVKNSSGEFYNSLSAGSGLPKCADAITAYHLAKKGLLLAERIKGTPSGEKVSLAIRNNEWLEYMQKMF